MQLCNLLTEIVVCVEGWGEELFVLTDIGEVCLIVILYVQDQT